MFSIYIQGLEYEKEYKKTLIDIEKKFFTKKGENSGLYYLLNEDFNEFIDIYLGHKRINWDLFSKNPDLPWNHEILTKYNNFWNWTNLINNPSIEWSTDFILKNAHYIHFGELIEFVNFEWTEEVIEKLQNLLHFTNIGIKRGISQTPKDYSYLKHTLNRRMTDYRNCSLSLSFKINWSKKLIDRFQEKWDWVELSANKTVCWDAELIEKYEDRVNFELLSINEGVKWTVDLINKYQKKWNWIYLSGNRKIPWSTEFIIANEESLFFGNEKIEKYKLEIIDTFTLSSNESIKWNIKLFDKYLNRLNIWEISQHGRISEEVLIKYHNDFNKTGECDTIFYSFSDWTNEFVIHRNCWQNLVLNPNIDTTTFKNPFFKNCYFEFSFPNGNLAKKWDIRKETISVYDLFQNGEKYIIPYKNT